MEPAAPVNPFPGLRPFEPDEDRLFFGREEQTDELLGRLRTTRFLVVTGGSGSGKSSLVRCGLIPSLHGGFMARAGSHWRIAIVRPGENPIGNLASALDSPGVLGKPDTVGQTSRILMDVTLRRSTLGLVDAVRLARIPSEDNVLVVVDQFEELFRFRQSRERRSNDEADAFVKLLLEAADRRIAPVYIVLTIRADFIGDCMKFYGLPEAINAGQYLVPRMKRDELRSAITGPATVAGGVIAPRLVLRLLNDCGDDTDQLPVFQHALMRTWDYWEKHRQPGQPVDIPDYEAIGTMEHALSLHAEEAYEQTESHGRGRIAERIFKALTDTASDPRGVRRPTALQELTEICEVPEPDAIAVIENFRQPGRSFLMPPASVALEPGSIIDVSHESLMRLWKRLVDWTEEERKAAERYLSLSRAASKYEEGEGALWRDPDLEFGLKWRDRNHPTAAWARRLDPHFERAMRFLDLSAAERDRAQAERRRQRRHKFILAWTVAGILGVFLGIALHQRNVARDQRSRARSNLRLAEKAVEEMLLSAETESSRVAAGSPEMEQLKRELLHKAESFYVTFRAQDQGDENVRAKTALTHYRLGQVYRLLDQPEQAVAHYQTAIDQLQRLTRDFPGNNLYQSSLGDAYNWAGETERPLPTRHRLAERAYDAALDVQRKLHIDFPNNLEFQQKLARTFYNRGILRAAIGNLDDADSDYREAIALLTPLSGAESSGELATECRQELARALNNRGLLVQQHGRLDEARRQFDRAIDIGESLTAAKQDNRDYQLELSKYYENLAILLEEQKRFNEAENRARDALALLERLSHPVPSLRTELAHAHDIQGRILESKKDRVAAKREYHAAIAGFETLGSAGISADFHVKYAQALLNLAFLNEDERNYKGAVPLLLRAVDEHKAAGSKAKIAWDYCELALAYRGLGLRAKASEAVRNASGLLPELAGVDLKDVEDELDQVKRERRTAHSVVEP